MTLKSLGEAEVIVNLNAHGDAAQIGSLHNYWISPDGKKVAYSFLYLEKGIAVEVKDIDSQEPSVRLTMQSCESLAWKSDSKHLFYIQRGPDDRCSNVTMYHPDRLPDTATRLFNGQSVRLTLHSTKSYNFLEHSTNA
ncbi:hypothetical protein H632_c80p4 [Helicosporidium sp. ATCC 50920]|nr:hypothetical protein H632_c80p4 [Helicosporidium sp. ATCC 50920]|eukprot:KDD76876.1 hypothetical protein H632_c80p4 [Helicosporidium sp. ATCC 50920]